MPPFRLADLLPTSEAERRATCNACGFLSKPESTISQAMTAIGSRCRKGLALPLYTQNQAVIVWELFTSVGQIGHDLDNLCR